MSFTRLPFLANAHPGGGQGPNDITDIDTLHLYYYEHPLAFFRPLVHGSLCLVASLRVDRVNDPGVV